MPNNKLKLNNPKILKKLIIAIIPGLIVAGFWAFAQIASPSQRLVFDALLPGKIIINPSLPGKAVITGQTITAPPEEPGWQCGDSLAYHGVDSGGNPITNYQYSTVQIGTQCWFAENLRATKYRDNSNIPNLTNNTDWQNDTTGAYAWYENNYATYGSVYGALYNWYAATNTAGLCPEGWRVPTDDDWYALTNYLSANSEYWCGGNNDYIAKSLASKTHWSSYGTACTVGNSTSTNNLTGFSVLPAGYRDTPGSFLGISFSAYLWSSTESGASAWYRFLFYYFASVYRYSYDKALGFSVRCLRE